MEEDFNKKEEQESEHEQEQEPINDELTNKEEQLQDRLKTKEENINVETNKLSSKDSLKELEDPNKETKKEKAKKLIFKKEVIKRETLKEVKAEKLPQSEPTKIEEKNTSLTEDNISSNNNFKSDSSGSSGNIAQNPKKDSFLLFKIVK